MWQKLKNNQTLKNIFDTKNLGIYAIAIIALSVAWSSAKIIQKNYELEKQIAKVDQQVSVQEQINKNQKLKNEYFKTDAYLDLASREYFGKSTPGERLILVPTEVAQAFVKPETVASINKSQIKPKPKIIQNWEKWLNFYKGKQQ